MASSLMQTGARRFRDIDVPVLSFFDVRSVGEAAGNPPLVS